MSDKYFVDTNVLVYAHDESAGPKHVAAQSLLEQLWNSGSGVMSTQVLQEFCVSVRRKAANPLSSDEIKQLIEDYVSWEIIVNTPESIVQALEIEGRYKIVLGRAHRPSRRTIWSRDSLFRRPGTWPDIRHDSRS